MKQVYIIISCSKILWCKLVPFKQSAYFPVLTINFIRCWLPSLCNRNWWYIAVSHTWFLSSNNLHSGWNSFTFEMMYPFLFGVVAASQIAHIMQTNWSKSHYNSVYVLRLTLRLHSFIGSCCLDTIWRLHFFFDASIAK